MINDTLKYIPETVLKERRSFEKRSSFLDNIYSKTS
jgi:hypothetical protein